MQRLCNLISLLDGYKVYIGLALGALVVLVNHFVVVIPGVDLDPQNWLADLYGLAMLATGRSAAKKFEYR